mgnify:CR=1 FL=1
MIIKIILLGLLIIINGIFSATEIAYLSLNKYELNKEIKKGNKKAKKILELLNDSSTFLSSIQISITLSGLLASAFAAENFASELSSILNISFLTTNVLIVIITIILSYFTLVFGELIPKKIGLAYSWKIAFSMVDIINLIILIFKPFIIVLRTSVNIFIKIFNIKKKETIDEDNLKDNIEDSSLEEFEKYLLLNVFEFNDTTVCNAMTNIEDTILIDVNTSKDELLTILKKYKYTRYPIIENNKIIGMLNVKDLILKKVNDFNIKDYIREIIEIDDNTIIDDAFFILSSKHEVMASVKKDNKVIGIITIEDIIEEVIGNIFDEYN